MEGQCLHHFFPERKEPKDRQTDRQRGGSSEGVGLNDEDEAGSVEEGRGE